MAKELGITDGWVVASDGAVTARLCATCADGYMLEDVLTFDVGPVARMALSRFPDVQVGVEEIGIGYRVNRLFEPHEVNGAQRVVSVDELGVMPASRAILRGPNVLDLLEPLRRHGVTATEAGPDWIDVTPRHLSKATSLENIRYRARRPAAQHPRRRRRAERHRDAELGRARRRDGARPGRGQGDRERDRG